AGRVLGELSAGVQLRGLGARLGVSDRGDGADGDAGLTLAVTIAEEVGGAVLAQPYAEAADGVVPDGVLGLTGWELEFGDGVTGELHGEQKSSGWWGAYGEQPRSFRIPLIAPFELWYARNLRRLRCCSVLFGLTEAAADGDVPAAGGRRPLVAVHHQERTLVLPAAIPGAAAIGSDRAHADPGGTDVRLRLARPGDPLDADRLGLALQYCLDVRARRRPAAD